jgi:hypothetical protein
MNATKVIGVTGLARTGKNLFCDIVTKQLKEKHNMRAKTYALAYELKKDCADFVNTKLGLDVFSEKTEDKNIFRDLLVWYGATKRKQTQGRYWIELLEKRITNELEVENSLLGEPVDVVIISDIRFAEYEKDEVFWLKNELKGSLVHISKFTYGFPTDGRHVRVINDKTKKIFVDPPNISEATNDPKIKAFADYKLEWEDVGKVNLINDVYLNQQVEQALKVILK